MSAHRENKKKISLSFLFIQVPDYKVINLKFPEHYVCILFKQETPSVSVVS